MRNEEKEAMEADALAREAAWADEYKRPPFGFSERLFYVTCC